MRKNVTINNYYITQKPQSTRPQQRPRRENDDEDGWAIGMGKKPFRF